jgi:hypothetical protein
VAAADRCSRASVPRDTALVELNAEGLRPSPQVPHALSAIEDGFRNSPQQTNSSATRGTEVSMTVPKTFHVPRLTFAAEPLIVIGVCRCRVSVTANWTGAVTNSGNIASRGMGGSERHGTNLLVRFGRAHADASGLTGSRPALEFSHPLLPFSRRGGLGFSSRMSVESNRLSATPFRTSHASCLLKKPDRRLPRICTCLALPSCPFKVFQREQF